MSNFCNVEYLQERLAAVCKERDELKKIVEKQARLTQLAMQILTEAERGAE